MLALEFMERVENKLKPGMPDVHYLHETHAGWIELKAEETFPNRIDFEPAQPLWLSRYWNLGGVCYVMLHVTKEDTIYVWAGKFARELGQENGCHDVAPMLKVKCNKMGWQQLYELFATDSQTY